jgi:DNA helicase HerA-like ATPase
MTSVEPAQGEVETLFEDRLARFRRTREFVERHVLPLATSVDGRRFRLQASLHGLALRAGGYVVLESEGRSRLGQITDLVADTDTVDDEATAGGAGRFQARLARGAGIVLDPDATPFHDAPMRPAEPREVAAWFDARRPARAGLTVGELLLAPGVPAVLDSGGFNRHTFMCGQSGSGKTYSLGVLLEQILAETTLRVIVLDPNSDYVNLGRVRPGADPGAAAAYAHVPDQVAVWGDGPRATHPLRLRFGELDPAAQGGVLGLDPLRDRDEYAVLLDLVRSGERGHAAIDHLEQLGQADVPGARALGLRAGNLGAADWSVWDPEARSLVEEMQEPTARCIVVDLGSLGSTVEQRLVTQAVLSTLWTRRHTRQPCLLVVDEAHNVCPAEPPDRLSALATDTAVQIAAEGRKFGLYLLTSTQRPHKVHENVVSQCDNLLLMRMNSATDVGDLERLFSFVPPGLMAGAPDFAMGTALVAGKLFPQAGYVRMGKRVTEEGGADVPTTWASRR